MKSGRSTGSRLLTHSLRCFHSSSTALDGVNSSSSKLRTIFPASPSGFKSQLARMVVSITKLVCKDELASADNLLLMLQLQAALESFLFVYPGFRELFQDLLCP